MAKSNGNLLKQVWSVLSGGSKKPSNSGTLQGSQTPKSLGVSRVQRLGLEIPIIPLRAINADLQTSYDLVEIATWSYEARSAMGILARDCFQQIDGRVASWGISEEIKEGQEVYKVHPEVVAIGRDIANRTQGLDLILGGDRLQKAVRDSLAYGDCFMELGFEKEGIGRNDWGISRSLYLPPLSMFVTEGEQGQLKKYTQRAKAQPSPEDITWENEEALRILQFSYEQNTLYGTPLYLQSIDTWGNLKAATLDIADAARSVSVSPWLHTMPEGKTEEYKDAYKSEYLNLLQDGVITNLFLLNGADVKKAASSSDSLSGMMDYWLQLRKSMIPANLPLWMFPSLSADSSSAKEISNQPSLAYARYIADLRSMVGTQIKKAVSLEIILRKGLDWFVENGRFDVVWSDWFISGLESGILGQDSNLEGKDNSDPSPDTKPDPKKDKTKPKEPKSKNSQVNTLLRESELHLIEPDSTDALHLDLLLSKTNKLILSGCSTEDFVTLNDLSKRLEQVKHKVSPALNGNH